jgi:hypothetical protein
MGSFGRGCYEGCYEVSLIEGLFHLRGPKSLVEFRCHPTHRRVCWVAMVLLTAPLVPVDLEVA